MATPVVGMVHLRPLAGSPRFGGDPGAVRDAAVRDAEALARGGVNALMVENFGDAPFPRGPAEPETIAHLAAVAAAVRQAVGVPIGVNVLRNDGRGALAVAAAVGAEMIRVNVLHGAVVADQGVIESDAAALMRRRRDLGLERVKVLADVRVKHAAPLAPRPVEVEVEELVTRCLADALVVSGESTGAAVDAGELEVVTAAARRVGDVPVWVGSGVTLETAPALARVADGLIVGTALKRGGDVREPVELDQVRRLVESVQGVERASGGGWVPRRSEDVSGPPGGGSGACRTRGP